MKPLTTLHAERPLARHCPELLGEGPGAPELLPALTSVADRLARALSTELAVMCAGSPPVVTPSPARETNGKSLAGQSLPLAAHCAFSLGGDAHLLATFEGSAVLRMLDRTFGGMGRVPDPLPDALPFSAGLLVSRLSQLVGQAIAAAAGPAIRVEPSGHGSEIPALMPCLPDQPLIAFDLKVAEGEDTAWTISLAITLPAARMLCGEAGQRPRPHSGARRHDACAAAAIGDLSLEVRATLVDMAIPFARLAALRAGEIIPVSVARNVPVHIAGKPAAQGTIGEIDDRVAVQITQSFINAKEPTP